MVLFCVCGAFGQLFIFATIKTFGSLANTLVCTTRKFFNILISVVVNGNVLLPLQWSAVAMVFTGLIASTLLKTKVCSVLRFSVERLTVDVLHLTGYHRPSLAAGHCTKLHVARLTC